MSEDTKTKRVRALPSVPSDAKEIPLTPLPKISARPTKTPPRLSDTEPGKSGQFVKEPIIGNFTSHFTYEMVPTDKLLIDARYQRDPIKSWISVLAHSWNEDKNNPFVVSLRSNGNYYVMDGQQRHGALQLMENPPDQVFAKVFRGLSVEQEADLFVSAAEDRKGLTTEARFKASVQANHQWAVAIQRAANEAGFRIGAKGAQNNIAAIAAAREIYRRRGEPFLGRVLRIIHQAWPDQSNAARSAVLYGLEYFLVKFPDAENRRLITALASTSPSRIEATGHGYAETLNSSLNPATGYAIFATYNHGLRTNKLQNWSW